jgi:Insect cuticle protein
MQLYSCRLFVFFLQQYAYGYRVRDYHTGNDFGHTQKKETDGVTSGSYHILLPDGRIQSVSYRAVIIQVV